MIYKPDETIIPEVETEPTEPNIEEPPFEDDISEELEPEKPPVN